MSACTASQETGGREIGSQQLSCLPTFAAVEFMLECMCEGNHAG